jgi:competence ComEA-like helix-hairpin-helix protein
MRHNGTINLLVLMFIFSAILISAQVYAQRGHLGGLGDRKVHLNIASLGQLMRIGGMTEELAEAIVDYRERMGFFRVPEDLLNVPGMTKEVYNLLDPQVGVEGDLFFIPKDLNENEDWDEDEEYILGISKC